MAKIITQKSQIPKSAQKKIKNFKNLTTNQAIYEYELNKLVQRAGKEYADQIRIRYTRPAVVTQKRIKEIAEFRGIKLKEAKLGNYYTLRNTPYTPFLEKNWKPSKLWDTDLDRSERPKSPSTPKPVTEIISYTDDEDDDYWQSDYTWDIQEESEAEKSFDSAQQFLKETDQMIDPSTGEVISRDEWYDRYQSLVKPSLYDEDEEEDEETADEYALIQEFFDDLKQEIENSAAISKNANSYYRNGKARSSRSRHWIDENIDNAKDALLNVIDSIIDSRSAISVYERFANDSSAFSALQDAIGEYLASSYSTSGQQGATQTNMNFARVTAMLTGSPMSMEDASELEQ